MSQNPIPLYLYEYDPASLGHPHLPGEPQITEPFWSQYPLWTRPSLTTNAYYYEYNDTMDTKPLIIGSNSRFGRNAANANANRNQYPKVKSVVNVYSNGHFIREVPFPLLVRFSSKAQAAFPKPKPGESAREKITLINLAEDDGKETDVAKVAAAMASLKTAGETAESVNGVSGTSGDQAKILNLNNLAVFEQPAEDAFHWVFNWMQHAQRHSKDGVLPAFGVLDPSKVTLARLVEMYAAALAVDVRPTPRQLRAQIYARLTENPPSIDDIYHIHCYLPLNDGVVTRMMNLFLQNRSARARVYSKAERDTIEEYFYNNEEKEFTQRFEEIEQHRLENRNARRREEGEQDLQREAEGNPGRASGTEVVGVNGQQAPAPANARPSNGGRGRRRNRRNQQGAHNGNGGKGKGPSK